jgi:hypothetical protein
MHHAANIEDMHPILANVQVFDLKRALSTTVLIVNLPLAGNLDLQLETK